MTQRLIDRVETGGVLTRSEAEALMEELLVGRIETPGIVRILTALNTRRVEPGELAAFARVMRRHAARVFPPGEAPKNLVDTCGTGGKSAATFNISTASAIVAAAAGARVAKHGNRGMSSRSGSADVLEALGVRIDLPLEKFGRAIREIGIGFLYAPAAHSATRHASTARKEMGVRTVFNLLGPLTNPAGASAQVLGVPSPELLSLLAETLRELGTERAFVVHGDGGLDEISLSGPTQITEVRNGSIEKYSVTPEEFGFQKAPLQEIFGGTPIENAEMIRGVLAGRAGPRRDIVAINAAAALVAAGVAADFRAAAKLASEAIATGAAAQTLERLVAFSQKE